MKKQPAQTKEPDSVYFLKLLMYFVLGLIWVRYHGQTILPIGLVLGLVFTTKDHFQVDRKVEFAVLIFGFALGLLGNGLYFAI